MSRKNRREVGIRELKARASELVDEVRESQASYVITHRGRPVGVLMPFGHGEAALDRATEDAWDELDRLGEEIGRGWESPQTAVDLLSKDRR